MKEAILDFINRNNNLDEIILIVIGLILGAILTAVWKNLAVGIRWIFKFIWNKITGLVKRFYNWIKRIKNHQLTIDQELRIRAYKERINPDEEYYRSDRLKDSEYEKIEKYLNKKLDASKPLPKKIKKPSKRKLKYYEEEQQKRKKEREEFKKIMDEKYPNGLQINIPQPLFIPKIK